MAPSEAQQEENELDRSGPWGKLKVYLSALGPGLITGASDDDPSGISWIRNRSDRHPPIVPNDGGRHCDWVSNVDQTCEPY